MFLNMTYESYFFILMIYCCFWFKMLIQIPIYRITLNKKIHKLFMQNLFQIVWFVLTVKWTVMVYCIHVFSASPANILYILFYFLQNNLYKLYQTILNNNCISNSSNEICKLYILSFGTFVKLASPPPKIDPNKL